MRENRTHGSEGGEDGVLSYPYFIGIKRYIRFSSRQGKGERSEKLAKRGLYLAPALDIKRAVPAGQHQGQKVIRAHLAPALDIKRAVPAGQHQGQKVIRAHLAHVLQGLPFARPVGQPAARPSFAPVQRP